LLKWATLAEQLNANKQKTTNDSGYSLEFHSRHAANRKAKSIRRDFENLAMARFDLDAAQWPIDIFSAARFARSPSPTGLLRGPRAKRVFNDTIAENIAARLKGPQSIAGARPLKPSLAYLPFRTKIQEALRRPWTGVSG
jgi:hypothetical protein